MLKQDLIELEKLTQHHLGITSELFLKRLNSGYYTLMTERNNSGVKNVVDFWFNRGKRG